MTPRSPFWRLLARCGLIRISEVRAMLADPVALRSNVLRHGPAGYDLICRKEIDDEREDAARQLCYTLHVERDYLGQVAGTKVTDSGGVSTSADLLRQLASAGRFRIVADHGRMVVGYWPENDPLRAAKDAKP